MTRQALREYGVRAYLSGENGFTFGRLHALEEARADTARREFAAAWEGRAAEEPASLGRPVAAVARPAA